MEFNVVSVVFGISRDKSSISPPLASVDQPLPLQSRCQIPLSKVAFERKSSASSTANLSTIIASRAHQKHNPQNRVEAPKGLGVTNVSFGLKARLRSS